MIGETPQPPGLAIDPSAGFTGVQLRRAYGFFGALLMPGRQRLGQSCPDMHQTARIRSRV